MFIEIDGEENVLLLVKVRSYTHREKSNPTNAVFLSRYMTRCIPGLKRPRSSLFFPRYSVRAMRVLREKCQSRSSDWLFISWYSETQDKDLGSCQSLFPHPSRGEIVSIMAYTGRFRPKGAAFFSPQVHK